MITLNIRTCTERLDFIEHLSIFNIWTFLIILINLAILTVMNILIIFSSQAGFSADGAGGSGLPAEGTWALSRALTQRTSQKIVFSIHQGSGGWGPSLLAADLVSRPLPHRSLSASNVKMQRKEAALI